MAIVKKLRRPCCSCGEMFSPTGRFGKICDKCLKLSKQESDEKKRNYYNLFNLNKKMEEFKKLMIDMQNENMKIIENLQKRIMRLEDSLKITDGNIKKVLEWQND